MAMYHLNAKAFARSSGRSATAAAAYRAGERILDTRSGAEWDYTRKSGVLGTRLFLPDGGTADRAAFWNSIENHHRRKDAVVAREIEISLPSDLCSADRESLAMAYARELSQRYGVAVDVALHAPRRVSDRDLERNPDQFHMTDENGRHNGNYHAHLLLSACHVERDGTLGKKCVELDPIHCKRHQIQNSVDFERGRWADLQNAALADAGVTARVDHRSHADRGIPHQPTAHLGGYAARMLREGRADESTRAEQHVEIRSANEELDERLEAAAQADIADAVEGRLHLQIRADLRQAMRLQADRERTELERPVVEMFTQMQQEASVEDDCCSEIEQRRQREHREKHRRQPPDGFCAEIAKPKPKPEPARAKPEPVAAPEPKAAEATWTPPTPRQPAPTQHEREQQPTHKMPVQTQTEPATAPQPEPVAEPRPVPKPEPAAPAPTPQELADAILCEPDAASRWAARQKMDAEQPLAISDRVFERLEPWVDHLGKLTNDGEARRRALLGTTPPEPEGPEPDEPTPTPPDDWPSNSGPSGPS